MSQTPITLTYSLEEILKQINQKLDTLDSKFSAKIDKLQEDVTGINVRLTKVETKLDTEIETIKADIKEIKGSMKAQIWTLIGVLGTAVVGTVIRFVITALPGNP